MILITTSNGVFGLDRRDRAARLVLPRRRGFWIFRRGSGGFFGIARHEASDSFLAASRERLGTPRAGKPATDARLYRIHADGRPPALAATLLDVHDVHQIAVDGDRVFLTDTGKNRVQVYDLERSHVAAVLEFGAERGDVNHINAVTVLDGELLVGLNNRGAKPAEIWHFDLGSFADAAPGAVLDGFALGRVAVLGEQTHTHDIEPFQGDLLFCASHEGKVYRHSTLRPILNCADWVRGLAVDADGLWVGASALADRASRHREDLDGQVHLYDPVSLELIGSWTLERAGQVNDIVPVPA